MKPACSIEQLSTLSTVARAQPHPRESRHQIEFARKGLAQPHWIRGTHGGVSFDSPFTTPRNARLV